MNIFKKINEIYHSEMPFVAFRKPDSNIIEVFEQFDDTVYCFDDTFSVSGFVLAPFEKDKNLSVIIKADKKYQEDLKNNHIGFPAKKEIPICNIEKEKHIQLIEKAIEQMQKGVFEKVVLSRKITLNHKANPVEVFEKMTNHYPSAFCYLFSHPKIGIWIAATPEKLLNVHKNYIYTMALAGTQPYKEQGDHIWKEKEKDEQQIVTDVILSKIATHVDNLDVSTVKTVRAGNVVHLCTDITAKLKSNENPFTIVNELHPTPAVCGFPNKEAKQFIIENEHYNRSYYSGYCGVVNGNEKSIDFYVNLRCMQLENNQIFIYVGGGILKESNSQAEWEETQNKAQTMFAIL
ncbi:isochorismate synthase [Capnocytophaga felis]|uniref:isochorismate synthase n=1 Tax=Capnocytophaga felis TaxID=2267611 RepID=A0A5M4B891_9FLAO|nr:isochorismate synthase [Capnocytophaga felis]GET45811.1 hypothetical protein RCZ01_11130 [Capnocytophaga felis]GET48080.1 hypothetical protein RCZ02_09110 [Capnocytophaga felis]